MNNLSIERLKRIRASEAEAVADDVGDKEILAALDELISIREQKGDQVPVALIDERQGSGGFCLTQHGRKLNLQHGTELFTAPQKPVVHPDTKRMNWLVSQHVEVRTPMVYGSHARFVAQCDSDDCEEYHTTLREQVDAAIEAAGGIVAGHNDKVDITCWSCRRFITFQQHAEADGFCPHCSVEIELDDKDG